MSDGLPARDDRDRVDLALAHLRQGYAEGRVPGALEARIEAIVRETPQRARPWRLSSGLSWHWPGRRGLSERHVAWAGITVTIAATVVGIGLIGATMGGRPTTQSTSNPATGSAPVATDVAASNAPHVAGTCPVTDITRLAGGTAPEVDVSGLRWRWGGIPWVVGVPEKVVWLTDSGQQPDSGVSLFGVRLDRPIVVDGVAARYPGDTSRGIYAAASSGAWTDLVELPEPGCWLLTAIWSGGASSVVVAAAPNVNPGGVGPTATPIGETPSHRFPACPATTPTTPGAGASGWPGHAYLDGPFRWLTPPVPTWRIGGDGDKLVLDSDAGWTIGDMRITAIPVVVPDRAGWLAGQAIAGDIPPGFGGGTLGFGMTLPNRGCWAFAYAGSQATSTIVIDLGQ